MNWINLMDHGTLKVKMRVKIFAMAMVMMDKVVLLLDEVVVEEVGVAEAVLKIERTEMNEKGVEVEVDVVVEEEVLEAEVVMMIQMVKKTFNSIIYYSNILFKLAEQKKREIYIPPEASTDENEIFHSGNTCGINFAKYDDIDVKVLKSAFS